MSEAAMRPSMSIHFRQSLERLYKDFLFHEQSYRPDDLRLDLTQFSDETHVI